MGKSNNEFYNILTTGTDRDLNEFLIAKGKSPKPRCPIQFDMIMEGEDNGIIEKQKFE